MSICLLLATLAFSKVVSAADVATIKLADLETITNPSIRKQRFFEYLVPMIRIANDEVWQERRRLHELATMVDQRTLASAEVAELALLGDHYGVPVAGMVNRQFVDALLQRVDTIPAALVLAQAANESGWGRSRFAIEGNNLFGIWCYRPGCGIKPSRRNAEDKHEVRIFETVLEGVRHYLRMLNSRSSFSELHKIRAELRLAGQNPTAIRLAEGLRRYSQRRGEYVRDIKLLIRENGLHRYTVVRRLDDQPGLGE